MNSLDVDRFDFYPLCYLNPNGGETMSLQVILDALDEFASVHVPSNNLLRLAETDPAAKGVCQTMRDRVSDAVDTAKILRTEFNRS